MDESCTHCGTMTVTILPSRLQYLKQGGVPLPIPRFSSSSDGHQKRATFGGLRIIVRTSRWVTNPELSKECAGPSRGAPVVSFGAPPDDRMSIAASEGELESPGEEDSAALPPSGFVTLAESDPELMAMLSRATKRVGFKWRPPTCPEPSRLDDWFLGAARAGSQHPAPVPFFPEVHDEVTRILNGTFFSPKAVCPLLHPHYSRWWGG